MKLTVVGNGSTGNPAVICLQSREKLYLFNCGDGTERVMCESGLLPSAKLHHVFITHFSWENVGGIQGKSLSQKLAEGHENKIVIHGAKELEELLDVTVTFAENYKGQKQFAFHNIEDGMFEDTDLFVEYVPLSSTKAIDQTSTTKKSQYIVRKCHVQKNADQTFGFVCVSKRSEAGIFIGNVTEESSAELCGLKPGDKIVEVNGINVEQSSHADVIDLIKKSAKEVCLLVVDEDCAKYCFKNNIMISSAMQETDMISLENSYYSYSAKQVIVKDLPVLVSKEEVQQLVGNDLPIKHVVLPWNSLIGMLEKNENAVAAMSKRRPAAINGEECEAVKKAINADQQLIVQQISSCFNVTCLSLKSREDAQAAVKRLNGVQYKNCTLKAYHVEEDKKRKADTNTIFLSNLPYSATQKDIEHLVMDEVENVTISLRKNISAPKYNIGDCFIMCKDSETRTRLKKKLAGSVFRGRTLYVDPSTFEEKAAEEISETVPQKGRPVMAYIVQFKKDDPKFKQEVLIKLGLKSGPYVADIIKGKTVVRDGHVLTPEMCLEEREIIRPLIVVECPSEDYLDSLLATKQFTALLENPDTVPQCIVHMTPSDVLNDPRYQVFMQRFKSEETVHLILKNKVTLLADPRAMMYFLSLNQIHSKVFPLLHYDQSVEVENGNIVNGVMNLQYIFKPRTKQGFSWKHVPDLNKEKLMKEFWEEVVYKTEAMKALEYVHETCKKIEETSQEKREYPVITFLGTGSCNPTKYRSVSCILVETSKDEFIILDCAEASVRQLYLMFGEERAEHILRNLKAIFISHLHHDHCGGILSLARKRTELLSQQNPSERLLLIAPAKLKIFFGLIRKHLFDHEEFFSFIPVVVKKAVKETPFDPETKRLLQHTLNVKSFTTIPVTHIHGSYGVHFEHQDGWSLMYSGDTVPCKSLVTHGYEKTDYLIHEATLGSSDISRAALCRHSTAAQALEVGRKMKAKHVILTHFSQRFVKGPILKEMGDAAFAFDFMQLKPKHIPLVTQMKPAFALLYKGINYYENFQYIDEQLSYFSETASNQTINALKRNNSDPLEDAPYSKEIRLEDNVV